MITLRKAEERRRFRRGLQDTWMTFDPENRVDPLRDGFHALESLNEETLGPGMGLHPHVQEDVEIITYVREGREKGWRRPWPATCYTSLVGCSQTVSSR